MNVYFLRVIRTKSGESLQISGRQKSVPVCSPSVSPMHVNRKVKEEASQQARPTVQGERTKEIFATLVASQTAGGGGDEARVAR